MRNGDGVVGRLCIAGKSGFDLAEAVESLLERRALAEVARAEVLPVYFSPADLKVDGDRVGAGVLIEVDRVLKGGEEIRGRADGAGVVSKIERQGPGAWLADSQSNRNQERIANPRAWEHEYPRFHFLSGPAENALRTRGPFFAGCQAGGRKPLTGQKQNRAATGEPVPVGTGRCLPILRERVRAADQPEKLPPIRRRRSHSGFPIDSRRT